MNIIFKIVYEILMLISMLTGFTYREVNIIIYYGVIPLIYFALIDKILNKHYFKIGHILLITSICIFFDFGIFCDNLFQLSVDFLLLFNSIGLNYIAASVVICVFLPTIILIILYRYTKGKKA